MKCLFKHLLKQREMNPIYFQNGCSTLPLSSNFKINTFLMKTLAVVFLILVYSQINAQNVGINTNPHPSAALDVNGSKKGILVPRVTAADRTSGIVSPAIGLLVFDTDSNAFAFWNGAAWQFLKKGLNNADGWSLKGNNGTNPTTDFIGTTDNNPIQIRINNKHAGKIGLDFGGNIALGIMSQPIDGGQDNISIGESSLSKNMSNGNVAVGKSALKNNETGHGNIGIGFEALLSNKTGVFNTAIGTNSMDFRNSGNFNTAVGHFAQWANYTGHRNTALGSFALAYNTIGNNNIAIGTRALQGIDPTTNHLGSFAIKNIAVGDSALSSLGVGANTSQANSNIALGHGAMSALRTANNNIAIGSNTMVSNVASSDNLAIGNSSLLDHTIGSENTSFGHNTLKNTYNSEGNTAVGFGALQSTTGNRIPAEANYNTAVGHSAMRTTSASNGTAIGAFAQAGFLNATAIGAFAIAEQNNSLVLGGIQGINGSPGNTFVGIGTTTPGARFDVRNENIVYAGPVVRITQFDTDQPALKISASSGADGGLLLENTAVKVSGPNKFVFQHTVTAGNQYNGNTTVLPNTGFANSSTDMLIVTPVSSTSGVILANFPIQVLWDNTRWLIANANGGAIPVGLMFNVMVVKQ